MNGTLARMRDGARRRVTYSGVRAGRSVVLRELNVAGERLLLRDVEGSVAMEVVAGEVGHGAYDFGDIPIRAGDTIIDLGGHIGVVSIFLAKQHPDVQILTFEPIPEVFALLQANLKRNRVHNVRAFNLAVTGDGRDVELVSHDSNTGGGTGLLLITRSARSSKGHGSVRHT